MFNRLLRNYCVDRDVSLSQLRCLLSGYDSVEIWSVIRALSRQDAGPFPKEHFLNPDTQSAQWLTGQHCATKRDFGLYTHAVEHLFRTYTSARGVFHNFDEAEQKRSIDRRLNLQCNGSSPEHITNVVLLATMETLLQCYKLARLCPEDCQWFREDSPEGVDIPEEIRGTIRELLKESHPLCRLISDKLFTYQVWLCYASHMA
ncbi:hypothetical protein MCOR08_010503 [Pyricularia oryzae]|nr:hypothetical protein MCOR15_000995 [Pyricularia oryzae]KAI6513429.1 hypothetical protein MCOR16_010886 [Pyricularia oryzae]KAI6612502.1 hypothetical protein MCOR08_010503 [Pyricularia oryzae]